MKIKQIIRKFFSKEHRENDLEQFRKQNHCDECDCENNCDVDDCHNCSKFIKSQNANDNYTWEFINSLPVCQDKLDNLSNIIVVLSDSENSNMPYYPYCMDIEVSKYVYDRWTAIAFAQKFISANGLEDFTIKEVRCIPFEITPTPSCLKHSNRCCL